MEHFTMTLEIQDIEKFFKDVANHFTSVTSTKDDIIFKMKLEHDTVKDCYENLKSRCSEKDDLIARLSNEVVSLKNEVAKLQEENAAFSKVSHIIAMEKENARLKNEISILIRQLSRPQKTQLTLAPTTHGAQDMQTTQETQTIDAHVTDNEKECVHDERGEQSDEEETFVTKKIKGTSYYVSEKDNVIYEKLVNGEVGERLGILEKRNEKIKAVWD